MSNMKLKKANSVDYVHQFSDIAFMKFKPKKVNIALEQQKPEEQNPLMSRIKSFINWRSPIQMTQSRASQRSALLKSSSQVSIKSISLQNDMPGSTILFLQKISTECYLIGNQNQIDLVFIGGVVGNFVDTQSLWELNIGRPIINLAIDIKKSSIAIQTSSQIVIYRFDNKKMKQPPVFLCGIKTKRKGAFMKFMKDSTLAVVIDHYIQIYVIEQQKMRKIMDKQIKLAAEMQLFQVPNSIQNCLNVFYTKKSQTTKTFQLWYIQVSLKDFQISISQITKVYDIKEGLYNKIKLENYSKQIFLMNLGFSILAVKKGYIIDSAQLNIQQESTFLHYIGNNRLLHLSPLKAQIYRFKINISTNPPRIQITSLDSIEIRKPFDYEYVGALQMLDRNFAVFFQIVPQHNRRTKGQITYCFAITRHITIQQKIREIFTFEAGLQLKNVKLQTIEERVDMAMKIGMKRTQIYLELWNRTNKADVTQYQFLLDTLDYETIKVQIQKKLKKTSLLWRQINKIQEACFQMIREKLFSPACNQRVVQEYLTSHFLKRKLELYRDISMAQKTMNNGVQREQSEQLKINIQNYNKYLKADIQTLFLQMIHQYCFQDKNVLLHIRIFLRSFRFIFRIIYKNLLERIVSTTKSSLIKLLQNFPQILPYEHLLDEDGLYEGVWKDISRTEWQKNLHLQGIITIDNREVISQIPATLWFRRNFLTQHDMTDKSKEQILKIHKFNNSDEIFYFFISNVFEHVSQKEPLEKIITFVQRNYQKMPVHLHKKIFLYRKIFEFFKKNLSPEKSNQKLKNFHDLLQMKDFELFKQFFEFQKIKKGCLLREIKQIYQQVGGRQVNILPNKILDIQNQQYEQMNRIVGKGTQWYNQGMLSYFSSDLSEISDLKYILNRINNAKIEFFADNQQLIYVLVQAVQLKLRIGSENDVPIQQILLYLENIPLNQGGKVLNELQKIQKISEQVQRFQQIKINMTIAEIINNCENVINALINLEIRKRKVMEVTSIQQMKEVSYDIIAEVQVIKQKIYTLEYSDLTFFVYLTKIMEEVHMIPYAAELIQDKNLKSHYSIDGKVVEDLILYMYKMKLTQNSKYIQNQGYLTELLHVLPEDNQCRIYISCQLQYAKLLSAPNNPVQYPLTDKSDGISIMQLQQRIQQLPADFLIRIDVEKLHRLMNKMQQICYEDFEVNFYTSINQIYQIIILKLFEDNRIVDSIPFVKKLLHLPNNQFAVIFPLFYIELVSRQLTVQCKRHLLKAVSYLFNEPLQLFKIVQQLINSKFTSKQRDQYFKDLSTRSEQYKKNYNPKNPILDPIFIELIRNQEMENNFKNMIEQCGHHIVKTKQDFNDFQFSLIFIILTQQPFALAKYIFCRRYHANFKVLRSFLSYIIKEQIFDSLRVLQFGRRLFKIVLESSQSVLTLQSIASQYSTISIQETVQFEPMVTTQPVLLEDEQFIKKAKILQSKLQKCIIAFDKKKISVLQEIKEKGPSQNIERKKQRIQKQLINPVDLSEKAPSEYPFRDSDDDYGEQQKLQDFSKSIRRRKKQKQFNPSLERNLLKNRTTKNYALFMSNEGEKQENLFLSVRPGKRKIINSKALAIDGSNSLRFSQGQTSGRLSFQNNQRKQDYMSGRLSQEHHLTQSIQCYTPNLVGITRSAVYKKERKSLNIYQQDPPSPLNNHSMDQSIQLQQQQIERKLSNKKQVEKQVPIPQQNYLKAQQAELVFNVFVKQVDENAFLPVQKLKQMILDSIGQQSDEFCVDLSQLCLEQDKDNGAFNSYLKSLIKSIYNDHNIKTKISIKIIKQIETLYPDIGISKEFLQIFSRFQSYHSKYDISIPMSEMFLIEYIFEDSKEPKHLFDLIAPKIVSLVDQSNIYKISKIIHLAFKASSFEQEFFFSYLCVACEKFDSFSSSSNEISMQLQKLTALIQKLPIHIVIQRGYKMIQNMKNSEQRQKIVQSMVNYVKKKKSDQQVNNFESKLRNK